MCRLISTTFIFLCLASPAWGNPCYSKAVRFQSVPHDKPSALTLEARRVKGLNGNVMTYDLGKETISITAEGFAARRFLQDVEGGRCSARETVRLEPERKSPFNTQFKAVTSRRSH